MNTKKMLKQIKMPKEKYLAISLLILFAIGPIFSLQCVNAKTQNNLIGIVNDGFTSTDVVRVTIQSGDLQNRLILSLKIEGELSTLDLVERYRFSVEGLTQIQTDGIDMQGNSFTVLLTVAKDASFISGIISNHPTLGTVTFILSSSIKNCESILENAYVDAMSKDLIIEDLGLVASSGAEETTTNQASSFTTLVTHPVPDIDYGRRTAVRGKSGGTTWWNIYMEVLQMYRTVPPYGVVIDKAQRNTEVQTRVTYLTTGSPYLPSAYIAQPAAFQCYYYMPGFTWTASIPYNDQGVQDIIIPYVLPPPLFTFGYFEIHTAQTLVTATANDPTHYSWYNYGPRKGSWGILWWNEILGTLDSQNQPNDVGVWCKFTAPSTVGQYNYYVSGCVNVAVPTQGGTVNFNVVFAQQTIPLQIVN